MDMTSIIQSLRDRARRMTSLDTPEDADLGDVALDIGAGFVPGVGSALGARDVVRGYREGDYLGMALGAAGMIPVVGGAASAINKVRRGDAIADALRAKYPDVKLDLSGDDKLYLGKIIVPKDKRSQGIGSSVMSDLIKQADEAGVPVSLSPSSDFGGSVGRLKEFYKRFGFVENKGRNKDFSISDSMYRQPVAPVADVGATVSALRAPRDEALEVARKNAVKMLGLPENNTAMDRARALGFERSAYHGTNTEFQVPTKDVFASEAPSIANRYAFKASDDEPIVMPLLVKSGTPAFEHLGANSYRLAPKDVRSRFAAFDPARINESDLLGRADPRLLAVIAGGGLTGLTVNALRNKRNEEKEKNKEKEEQ